MRWTNEYQRVVKRFAIFPVKAWGNNHKTRGLYFEYRWLETVYLAQHKDWRLGVFPYWRTDRFATKREYELYLEYVKNRTRDEVGEVKSQNESI